MIRKGLLLSLVPLTLITVTSLWGYSVAAPDARFPIHWGFDGQPDRYGGRSEAFLLMPALAFGLTILLAVVPAFDPRGDNLRRSAPAYLTAWLGTLGLLAAMQAGLLMIALGVWDAGPGSPFHRLVAGGISVLIMLIGNVLGKARPNWFIGVRTPWALSSDLAWERTHRVAGRLFVLVGLAGLGAALVLPSTAAMPILLVGVIGAAISAACYSYVVWRTAPDKTVGPQVVDS